MGRGRRVAALLAAAALVSAAPQNNQFEIVGNSGVSAQQMFYSTPDKVVIIDKTEANGNGLSINGHPVWATEYDINTNKVRSLDVTTNSFCAGGNVMADGTWLNVGGNQAIGYGGVNAAAGGAPYHDTDGGKAVRVFKPCEDGTCEFDESLNMTTRRWYPTLETLEDGTIIIIGGCDWGGYVNDASQNNPTFEYYPSKGDPIGLNILLTSLPANLLCALNALSADAHSPHTFLLPSGKLFINSNLQNEIFDYKNNVEHPISAMPHAVRVYPGSAATAMMPLTPANNYTATIVFCGGTNLQPDQWVVSWNIAAYPADTTCVSITPDVSTAFVDEDTLPEGRSMGNMIALPDGRFVILNGQLRGTAGYGNQSWAIGQSYGDGPIYAPLYYDRSLPKGQRLYRTGMGNSTVDRMYHSSAILLLDGSIMSSGSNPNADYIPSNPLPSGYKYPTEYRVERFYPSYYTATRPKPTGLPSNISYGGAYFDVKLAATDLGNSSNLANTKVVIIRTGFSTHAMNMGQRYVQLNNTATLNTDGSGVLHVSQLPPNPAILVPGPAMIFVVVNGVPSQGQWITVGNGVVGTQPTAAQAVLPANSGFTVTANTATNSGSSNSGSAPQAGNSGSSLAKSDANGRSLVSAGAGLLALLVAAFML